MGGWSFTAGYGQEERKRVLLIPLSSQGDCEHVQSCASLRSNIRGLMLWGRGIGKRPHQDNRISHLSNNPQRRETTTQSCYAIYLKCSISDEKLCGMQRNRKASNLLSWIIQIQYWNINSYLSFWPDNLPYGFQTCQPPQSHEPVL